MLVWLQAFPTMLVSLCMWVPEPRSMTKCRKWEMHQQNNVATWTNKFKSNSCKLNVVLTSQKYKKKDKIHNKRRVLKYMWRALLTGNNISVTSFATTYLHCLIMALLRYYEHNSAATVPPSVAPCPHTEDLQWCHVMQLVRSFSK
jgi:hypothetical protein